MNAIGIDLGTTFSCVGHFANDKVKIIENDHGNRTTPSFVGFKDNEQLVGDSAQQQAALNPTNTIFDAKRLIGRKFDDPDIEGDLKHYPFNVTANNDGDAIIQAEFNGQTQNFTPQQISSLVVAKMKETAERSLNAPVKNAVITVPAYFNDAQRTATRDAGFMAGLSGIRIINEPTAAALAYGLDKNGNNENILIFDFGGGTFDVSLLNFAGNKFKVVATAGDTHLGGEDIDNLLVEHFVVQFMKDHNTDLSLNKRALRRLRSACERTKRKLSFTAQTTIEIDYLHEGHDLVAQVTRKDLELLCHDLFERLKAPIDQLLSDAKLTKSQINEVVMVGGSTRIPAVQQIVSDYFGNKKLNCSINPDEAVATGAAIYGASLSGEKSWAIQNLEIKEVTTFSLGVSLRGGLIQVLVDRNTELPVRVVSNRVTIKDYQPRIDFSVYEGERKIAKYNTLIGRFSLVGIPEMLRGQAAADLVFELDVDGILNITAIDKSNTANKSKLTIERDSLFQSDLDKTIKDATKHRNDDEEEVKRIKAKCRVEDMMRGLKKLRAQLEDHITPFNMKALNDALLETKHWLKILPNASVELCNKKIIELEVLGVHASGGNWSPKEVRYQYVD